MISQESKTFLEVEMENKTRRFLKKLPFFHKLPEFDKEIILRENVPMGVLFQKCTFFNPSKSFQHLIPINSLTISISQTSTCSSSCLLYWARKRPISFRIS